MNMRLGGFSPLTPQNSNVFDTNQRSFLDAESPFSPSTDVNAPAVLNPGGRTLDPEAARNTTANRGIMLRSMVNEQKNELAKTLLAVADKQQEFEKKNLQKDIAKLGGPGSGGGGGAA